MPTSCPRARAALLGGLCALLLVGPAAAQDFVVRPPAESFQDVAPGHWAYEAVEWLRSEGLLEGWGKRFHGRRTFTRYEMAEILARYTQRLLEAQRELGGLGDGSPRAGDLRSEVEHLREVVERIAKVVSTHQALLEDPGAQRAWRKKLEAMERRRARTRRRLRSSRPPRGARARRQGRQEERERTRKRRLLSALDRLQASRSAPSAPEPADDFVYFGADPAPPARALLAQGPGTEDHQRVAHRSAPPPPARPAERAEMLRERLQGLLSLSRVMRGPTPRALPGPARPAARRAEGRALNERLLDALDEVREGALEPEKARVIGYLASLALQARQLEE